MNKGYHKRADDPPDAAYSHMRSAENDKIALIGDSIVKYVKPMLPFLIAFGGWFMATVWKPIQQVPALVETTKTLLRNDSLSVEDRRLLHQGQNVTNRILCFNLDQDDRSKYDIDCGSIPLPIRKPSSHFQ